MALTLRVPSLSVIIPVLDDAEHLRTCLIALRRQTRPVDEIIVVDNGSTDESARVARDAGARVIREQRPGIPAAAFAGMSAATGDVLARIDADTVLPGDWSLRVVRAFDVRPDIDALTGPGEFEDLPRWRARIADALYMRAYFRVVAVLVGQKPVFGSNYAVRASTWRAVRGELHLGRHVHDDMDLSFVLDGRARILFDPSLTVGISPRPVTSPRALAKHFLYVVPTIAANWRDRGPLRRIRDRRRVQAPVVSR